MLPVIPFDILLPLALIATFMCLSIIIVILGRRAFIKWWSRGGARLTRQLESLLISAYSGEESPNVLTDWFESTRSVRIESFVEGVQNAENGNGELRQWIARETDVPKRLSEILVDDRDSGVLWTGRRQRWTRVAAARAIGELDFESEIPVLIEGLDDPDNEVRYAAGSALSRLNRPTGADAILQRIESDSRLNNSRLASFVETMDCGLDDVFRKHLERDDSQAQYWTATLVGHHNLVELAEDVRPLLESPDPDVRAAACECVGELGVPLTGRWLAPRLDDDEWFVRSHAAKALGRLEASWAVPDLVNLLYSEQWWVRQNTAEALINIGREAAHEVEKVLASDDRFARNTTVEILERIGWVSHMVERAARADPGAVEFLHQFGVNGGVGYLENALFTSDEDGIVVLLEVLRDLGDDATYGRIRAAAEQMPERLRPLAYSIASEVQGR